MRSGVSSALSFGLLIQIALALGCGDQRFPVIKNRGTCYSNLREIHQGIEAYKRVHSGKLADDILDGQGRPLLSWRVRLLPYRGHEEFFEKFRLEESWDSSANKQLLTRLLSVFSCPNIDIRTGLTGYRSCWLSKEPGSLQDSSIQCLESGNASVLWTKPEIFSQRDFEKLNEPRLSVHGRRYFGVNDPGSIVVVNYDDPSRPILHMVE